MIYFLIRYPVFNPPDTGLIRLEADGGFKANASGGIDVVLGNHNGGANVAFNNTMNSLRNQTRLQAQALSDITQTPMGVIAERLPTISLRPGEMQLNYKDPQTGESYARTFDLEGNYTSPGKRTSKREFMSYIDPKDSLTGQLVDSANFFNDTARQFSDLVTKSGAIAPQWEVDTIKSQRERGSDIAGLTTQQIATRNGTSWWYGGGGTSK